jgi:hypothetical protein
VAKPEALAVVHQHLDRRTAAIAENENRTGERISLEGFFAEPR